MAERNWEDELFEIFDDGFSKIRGELGEDVLIFDVRDKDDMNG